MLFNSIDFAIFLPIVFYTLLVCCKQELETAKLFNSCSKLSYFTVGGIGDFYH